MFKLCNFLIFKRRKSLQGNVSILIPTMFDSRYIIELCVKSIQKNTDYPHYQIIICDSGADEVTKQYLRALEEKQEIRLIQATDWQRPKDDLVKAVDSEYYILMHDDIQILKKDWLTRRLTIMQNNLQNAIVGTIVRNYNNTKRFFPLGLLVKTEISRKLNLVWGKQPDKGFDTGALAYHKFFSQTEYTFIPYKVSRDIKHFSDMTWPKYNTKETCAELDIKLKERDNKIKHIQQILKNNVY